MSPAGLVSPAGPMSPPGPPGIRREGQCSLLRNAVVLAWRAHWSALIGQVVVTVLGGLAPVAAACLLRLIVDAIASGHAHGSLLPLIAGLGLVGCVSTFVPAAGQYMAAQAGRAIERHTLAELFSAVGRLAGLRTLESPDFHDRLLQAQQAGAAGPGQIVSCALGVGQSALTLGGFLVTLAVISPVMALIVVAAAIPAVFAERALARRRFAMFVGTSHAQRRQYFYLSLLSERAAAKEIRLFDLGGFFGGRMLAELRTVQEAGRQVDRRVLTTDSAFAVLCALVTAGGLWWAVLAAGAGRLTLGDLTMFVASLAAVAGTLTAIITNAAMAYQATLMFRCYQDVLAEKPDLPLAADPRPALRLRDGIELQDVWFRYGPDAPWILRGVSCFIPHGQVVALVGRNGAGKSTLVKLLCRLYDPDRGRILWDGVDLRQIDLAGLRGRISAVFQDYMEYDLSVADNIAVGDLAKAGHEQALVTAARRAGVHDSIAALPRQYQTLLSRAYWDLTDSADPQAGVLLSGGQWQRIAAARAFVRGGRDLAILDEPSSGLDAQAEHDLHESLRADRASRATVLISHRLNTVRGADKIVVLQDGVVREQGDHDGLMARGGQYAQLFRLQARGYLPAAETSAAEPVAAGSAHG
jgi:ATP-binding cassette subfamily B protein